MIDYQVYGWEMTVHFANGTEREYHRVARTEAAARRLGMLLPQAVDVTNLRALTRSQYESSYGRRDLR